MKPWIPAIKYFNIFFILLYAGLISCGQKEKGSLHGTPQQLVFVRRDGAVNHIYLMDVDSSSGIGSNTRRLTQNSEAENYPSPSPDGKKILYQRDVDGAAIYAINIDGSGQQRLSPTPGFDVNPTWSPDGRQILFVRVMGLIVPNQQPKTEIHVMNADGSGDHIILPSTVFSVEPRWSVQNQIVFMSSMNGGLHIFTMQSDGTNIRQLTTEANNGDPVWSPDGRRISFGSDREGNGKLNIFTMNADGSEVKQLTHFDIPVESGDTYWSADGTRICFEMDINGHLQSDPEAYAEVWTMLSDGTSQRSTHQSCSGVGCAPRWLH